MPDARRCALPTAALLLLGAAGEARAQLKGHYVPGFTGLMNGTQAPPGISVALPVYFYTTDRIIDDDGHALPRSPRINVTFIAPVVAWVSNGDVLGARIGGSVAPVAVIKQRIEGRSLDVPGQFRFTDIFAQPLQLGWHARQADFLLAYNVFIPTGRWVLGSTENSGIGMWSNLPQAGTTVYLDEKRRWNASTLASYEFHTWKRDTPLRTGQILTLEGGVGRTFVTLGARGGAPVPVRVATVGPVYYAQLKTTSDNAGVLTPLVEGRRDRVFAVGLEGNLAYPAKGFVVDLRVVPEVYARNRTKGVTAMLTIGYELKSFVKPHEAAEKP